MDKHLYRINDLLGMAEGVQKVGSGQLAAGVYYANKLISVGVNLLKTHPLQARFAADDTKIYLHAETSAIARARKILTDEEMAKSLLYVTRAKKIGGSVGFGLAKSCGGCISCAYFFGIKKIYYSLDGFDAQYAVLCQ